MQDYALPLLESSIWLTIDVLVLEYCDAMWAIECCDRVVPTRHLHVIVAADWL